MEDVRYAASFAAGPSNKDKIKELGDKHQNLRHVQEKSEGSQELVQRIEGGLAHIAEMLGAYLYMYMYMYMRTCILSSPHSRILSLSHPLILSLSHPPILSFSHSRIPSLSHPFSCLCLDHQGWKRGRITQVLWAIYLEILKRPWTRYWMKGKSSCSSRYGIAHLHTPVHPWCCWLCDAVLHSIIVTSIFIFIKKKNVTSSCFLQLLHAPHHSVRYTFNRPNLGHIITSESVQQIYNFV